MTLLAKRYATALHLAARDQGVIDAVASDLQALHEGLQDPVVAALWQSPELSGADRMRVAEKLAQGRHALVGNLLQVLLHRHRQEVLPDLYPQFRAIVMAERGEVEAVVETPRPLADAELERLRATAQQLSGKTCHLSVAVRPELIGGVRLTVGNVLYDGSVQSALQQLEQKLLQAAV
ncbi:MAG: ATP synthase F1 subunit delta [Planctomycetota bacterium]